MEPSQTQQLAALLKLHYGIDIQSIQILPLGADTNAISYTAETESQKYFVKVKHGNHDISHLSILRLLHDAGLKEIIFPIPTQDESLFLQFENFSMIVFPFISAPNGFTRALTKMQWEQLGKALKIIHQTVVPTLIREQLRKEVFTSRWRQMVKDLYNQLEFEVSDDEITKDFKTYFKEKLSIIQRLVDSAEGLAKRIQPDLDRFVLCHSDIHAGNVLVAGNESIYIIDWDAPMLAPKERDLMFIGGGVGNVWNKPEESNYFYDGYGETLLDKTMLSYYRHERILEDIALFGHDLRSHDHSKESRLEMLKHFKAQFNPNGVVEIAFAIF